ncbi:MAG: SufD family Fe-S cluster assembly protein [Tissierellia bacterium]|nr:SufD family Fe-S cluster assembly protein [Tissierellia bacterium]
MTKTNTLPKLTWRWLVANNGETKIPYIDKVAFTQYEDELTQLPEHFTTTFEKLEYGVSKEALEINEKYRNWTNNILVDEDESLDRRYDIKLEGSQYELIDLQNIYLKENAKLTLIYDYESSDNVEFFKNTLFKIKAEKNSHLKLVLIQKLSHEGINLLSIVSDIAENAEVELIEVDLGAKETYTNYKANLLESGAKSTISGAYFVDGERKHDANYHINHIGDHTKSDMLINGALKDKARKRFVGTLDFKTGSHGSEGSEEEFLTLIDEEVKSIALPLLLAAEHDIVGNHAASAGRIDQDMLIYLMSRGLNEKEAKGIVVEAKMVPTIDLIPDEKLKEDIKHFIHEGITK